MNRAVIGCGYLGSAIAAHLGKRGDHVTATTRSIENLKKLAQVAHTSQILKGTDEKEFIPLILNNDTLIVTIGADHLDSYGSAYLGIAEIFKHLALEMDLPRHLIYTSSTSVYGDHNGLWVDEESPCLGKDEQAKILKKTEETYLSLQELGWHITIFRLAQLYGPGRELSKRVKELEGHTLPNLGDHYSNMIHRDDVVYAVDYAIRHHLEGIFNLADDEHTTRKELYNTISHKFNLPLVQWDTSHTGFSSGNKKVSNHKIKAAGFFLHHPQHVLE